MFRLLVFCLFFLPVVAYAQQPTGLPKPETREVPEQWQDPLTLSVMVALTVLIVGAILYFIRFDKRLGRRWRR